MRGRVTVVVLFVSVSVCPSSIDSGSRRSLHCNAKQARTNVMQPKLNVHMYRSITLSHISSIFISIKYGCGYTK